MIGETRSPFLGDPDVQDRPAALITADPRELRVLHTRRLLQPLDGRRYLAGRLWRGVSFLNSQRFSHLRLGYRAQSVEIDDPDRVARLPFGSRHGGAVRAGWPPPDWLSRQGETRQKSRPDHHQCDHPAETLGGGRGAGALAGSGNAPEI